MDAVFVTKWQVEEEIVERIDAALGEKFGALGADAFDHADFGGQREGHRCVIYTIGAKGGVKIETRRQRRDLRNVDRVDW